MAFEVTGKKRIGWVIAIILFYLLASYCTFLGTKIGFPLITNEGRSASTTLPVSLTLFMPMVFLYLSWLFWRSKTIKNRLGVLYIAGLSLILIGGFDITVISLVLPTLLDGNILFGIVTPCYPLDVIIINAIYIIGGIGVLIYRHLDRKYVMTAEVMPYPIKTKEMVFVGFLLPFACYFSGQFMYGITYIFDGYADSNWMFSIAYYLLFGLLSYELYIYIVTSRIKDSIRRKKIFLTHALVLMSITIVLFAWIIIANIINPYHIFESLQYEFEIGLAANFPFGIFVILAWVIIPVLVSVMKILFSSKKKRGINEQEQKEIQ